jgi:DnaJ-related protein SCJ1
MVLTLSAAYEVLSDEETRSIYDRYGAEGLKQHEAQKQGGGMHHNPFDMFSQFFGESFHIDKRAVSDAPLGGQRQQEKRGPSMLTQIEVDLADMYMGKHVEVSLLAVFLNTLTLDLVHCAETNSL